MDNRTFIVCFVVMVMGLGNSSHANDDDSHDDLGSARDATQQLINDACSPGTQCVPLNYCPLVQDLMEQSCLASPKLRELACGYHGLVPMVCCPRGGNCSPFPLDPTKRPRYIPNSPHSSDCPPVYQGIPTRVPAPSDNKGYTPQWGDAATPSPTQGVTQTCGRPLVRVPADDKLGMHPWVARIGFLDIKTRKTNYVCLGTIISSSVILTSAKCANASTKTHYLSSVRVGEYDSKRNPDCNSAFCASPVQVIRISRAVIHGGYDGKTYKDNIALVFLNTSIQFSVAAQPLCVLQSGRVPLEGRRATLVGWGRSTNALGQEVTSSTQQQLEMPIVSLVQCAQTFGDKVPITVQQLCAGGEAKRDACTGFTGAPLVLLEHLTFSRYYLVGIMSFGSDKCGRDETPSVFTSVHHYIEWIKENMA